MFGNLRATLMRFFSPDADTVRVLELASEGTNGASTKVYVGDRSPVGAVTGSPGEFYIRVNGVTSQFFQHQGAVANDTDWAAVAMGDFLLRSGANAMFGNLNFGGFKGVSAADPTAAQDVATKAYVDSTASGTGDVDGPASAADNAVARYDGTTGKLIQDSLVTISDPGSISLPATQTVDGRDVSVDGTTLDTHVANLSNPHATTATQVGAPPTSRTLTAGSGMAGGGDLSADRTFDVVAAAGGSITVNPDSIQRAALTGDVTAPADSNATTIANDAVTFAKVQNVATDSLAGRDTAGSGDLEEIAVNDGLEFTGAGAIHTVKASTTEVLTGTDAVKAVTPDALAAIWEKGGNVASAATVSLGEGGFFHITGTTTITDIDFATPKDGRIANFIFDGVLTLTHSATLQLPGTANIVTAAGDRACFVQDAGDTVICVDYQRAAQLYGAPTKEVFMIPPSQAGSNLGDHPTVAPGSNGSIRLEMLIPHDFISLVALEAVCVPTATNAAANMTFDSDYMVEGALYNANTETQGPAAQSLVLNTRKAIDLSGVWTTRVAGQTLGILITHNTIGQIVHYLGIRLRYN